MSWTVLDLADDIIMLTKCLPARYEDQHEVGGLKGWRGTRNHIVSIKIRIASKILDRI